MPVKKTVETIEVNGKQYDISKMPLGRFADFLAALGDLPTVIFNGTDDKDFATSLVKSMATHANSILNLVSIASGITLGTLRDDCGIDDLVRIIKAILAVNNIEYLKKELAPMFKKVQSPAPASGTAAAPGKANGLKG